MLDTGLVKHLAGSLCHFPHGPAEDRATVLAQRGPLDLTAAELLQLMVHRHGVPLRSVRADHRLRDARLVGGTNDCRARSIAKEEGNRAVGGVDHVGQLLGADHEDVLGHAGADERIRLGDRVTVPGASGREVVCRHVPGTDPVANSRRSGGRLDDVRDGRDEHGADLRGLDAGGSIASLPAAMPMSMTLVSDRPAHA